MAKKGSGSHIAFILDRSGSMGQIWDDVKGGFKQFIEDQKAEGDPKFSLTVFDTEVDQPYDKVPLSEVSDDLDKIEPRVYPRGSTALLDAVGKTINSLDKRAKKVMVVIFTDGLENSSTEYKKADIKKIVDERQQAGWGFLFLGADQDAFAEGVQFGMLRGQTASFDSAVAGSVGATMGVGSRSTSAYLYKNKNVSVPDKVTPK